MTDPQGKRVVVMGLGRFGGGVGVTRWLVGQGARVTVTDLAGEDELGESIKLVGEPGVRYALGGHDEGLLDDCDLLVVNPAVPKGRSEFFQHAVQRGIPWASEMNLFFERCPARVIGVTGSAGKSTTAAMLFAMLDAALPSATGTGTSGSPTRRGCPTPSRGGGLIESPGAGGGSGPQTRRITSRPWLGGNIGRSLLDELPNMIPNDWVVLELSSFQLEDLRQIKRSPTVAVVTNFAPNHLDRHGTLEAYCAAKQTIVRFQRASDIAVIPSDCSEVRQWFED